MYELTVPKLNSNDVSYVLTEWLYPDGDPVPPGVEVAVIETSKAAEGIACEVGGILLQEAKLASECRPGEIIARVFEDRGERDAFLATVPAKTAGTAATGPVITEPAMRLIRQYGLDTALLGGRGEKVIRRADVERLLDEREGAGKGRQVLSRNQLAVAEMVTLAHRTIPAAHATVAVTIDTALDSLREYSSRIGIPVRLPELLIRAIADVFPRYPLFFATIHDHGEVTLATEARIGVTVDVGRGLTVPVVAGAAVTSLKLIAETLTRFRETALHGRFTEGDLAGSNIGISLPAGEVILVQPLVLPGHACMLSLTSPQAVPVLEPDGRLTCRQVVHIGLAYDHRLVNGRDAAGFLGAVKQSFESPHQLGRLID